MLPIPINGGFYESDSLPESAQKLVNWRVNIPQTENALSQAQIYPCEGIDYITTSGLTNSANRGSHVKDGVYYFLNGTTFYRLDRTVVLSVATYAIVSLGTISGTARASFADNGTQLMIVVGGLGWIMNEAVSPTITPITDPAFTSEGVPEQVVFLDSYFILTLDSKKFLRSASNNGLSWSALNSFTAEADPDDIVAPIVLKNQLMIAGSSTIEFYQDLAGIFQRINGMIVNKGVYAAFGIANTSDSVMFVGGGVNESPAIWSISGAQAQKVSTTPIDFVLSRMSIEDIQAAFAYSYAKAGAYIVGFTFPGRTFEYNTITNKWNERSSRIVDAGGATVNTRWRSNSLATAYNLVLVADNIDGRIGSLTIDAEEEYGFPIIRTFTTMPFSTQGKCFSVSKLEMTMESGTGSATNDPQMRMSYSHDGGRTYNNEISKGWGKIGQYLRRVIWRKLGRFDRLAVLKFETSEAFKAVIIKIEARIKQSNGN